MSVIEITTPKELGSKTLPGITIGWDAEVQDVFVDHGTFTSMPFIIALLEMAKLQMEARLRIGLAQGLQKAQQQAMQQEVQARHRAEQMEKFIRSK
jgi:hypothetical protein